MPIPLLGGHIRWRAPNALARTGRCAGEFSDAEVGEEQVGTIGLVVAQADEEVGGLDILVNDVLVMGMLQRIGGLLEQERYFRGQKQPGATTLPQPARHGALFT